MHATILAHDASPVRFLGKVVVGKVIIGKDCFVGAGAILLPDTKVGDNCIVGAGPIVSRDIPPNSVAVGVPARPICSTEEYLRKCKKHPFAVGSNLPNIPTLKQVNALVDEVRRLNALGRFDR